MDDKKSLSESYSNKRSSKTEKTQRLKESVKKLTKKNISEDVDVDRAIAWYTDTGVADEDAEQYCPDNPDDWNVDHPDFVDAAVDWYVNSYYYELDGDDEDDDDEFEESLKKHKYKKSTCKIKEEFQKNYFPLWDSSKESWDDFFDRYYANEIPEMTDREIEFTEAAIEKICDKYNCEDVEFDAAVQHGDGEVHLTSPTAEFDGSIDYEQFVKLIALGKFKEFINLVLTSYKKRAKTSKISDIRGNMIKLFTNYVNTKLKEHRQTPNAFDHAGYWNTMVSEWKMKTSSGRYLSVKVTLHHDASAFDILVYDITKGENTGEWFEALRKSGLSLTELQKLVEDLFDDDTLLLGSLGTSESLNSKKTYIHMKESVDFIKYQGKPYTTIFRELLTQENGGIKPPYHAQNYNNGAYNVLVWYIPEEDYESTYASMFERAAQSIRSTGARCDIVVKPGYSNNRWGDDASHAVWVYTNRGVMEEPTSNAVKTDVRVPSPFDKHFRIKTNITDKPFSVPGYSEKVIAWLSPISRAAKEFLDSMTINGRACLTDAEDFPICTYEKGWNRRDGGLYPISVKDLENIETAQL